MIISVSELKKIKEFQALDDNSLLRKINAVECLIRSYTNNNFQNRTIRFECPSSNGRLLYNIEYLKVGDTIQISESINQGVYDIESISDTFIKTTQPLYDDRLNLVTKVEYPPDVVEGAVNMLIWDVQNRSKVGIQSETISRHSVTYFSQDAGNELMGYPIALLGFLKPYNKARF